MLMHRIAPSAISAPVLAAMAMVAGSRGIRMDDYVFNTYASRSIDAGWHESSRKSMIALDTETVGDSLCL